MYNSDVVSKKRRRQEATSTRSKVVAKQPRIAMSTRSKVVEKQPRIAMSTRSKVVAKQPRNTKKPQRYLD